MSLNSSNYYGTHKTTSTVNSSSLLSNPTLYSKKFPNRNYSNSLSTSNATSYTMGTASTAHTTGNVSSFSYLPFSYQQSISQRCTLILRKFHQFLQFHLIENFGCDFAATGLCKEPVADKIKSFFQKKQSTNDMAPYDTYVLYYCGPTSTRTDNLSFIDGNELSIEEIVDYWKEINCSKQSKTAKTDSINETTDNENSNNDESSNDMRAERTETIIPSATNKARLIIIIDSENTAKALDYVKSKLVESNVYVALQTAKYNFNNNNNNNNNNPTAEVPTSTDIKEKTEAHANDKASSKTTSVVDPYLNIGKFTLDWLKSNNCNFYNPVDAIDDVNYSDHYYYTNKNEFDEEREHLHIEEDDEDEGDDSDELDMDLKEAEKQTINRRRMDAPVNNNSADSTKADNSIYYEAKCAFSRYWIDFSFDGYEKIIEQDFNQFWRLYYPYGVCKPLLKLINCRLFYLKLNFFKRILFYLRRFKNRIMPIHEFDTGHGFKLFAS